MKQIYLEEKRERQAKLQGAKGPNLDAAALCIQKVSLVSVRTVLAELIMCFVHTSSMNRNEPHDTEHSELALA